jgi:integrase
MAMAGSDATLEGLPSRRNRTVLVAFGGWWTDVKAVPKANSTVKAGLTELTSHDLGHAGQTLAVQTGATTADLMKRLGHSSMTAARRYPHTVEGRDREIAIALSELAKRGDPAGLPRCVKLRP